MRLITLGSWLFLLILPSCASKSCFPPSLPTCKEIALEGVEGDEEGYFSQTLAHALSSFAMPLDVQARYRLEVTIDEQSKRHIGFRLHGVKEGPAPSSSLVPTSSHYHLVAHCLLEDRVGTYPSLERTLSVEASYDFSSDEEREADWHLSLGLLRPKGIAHDENRREAQERLAFEVALWLHTALAQRQ